MASYKGIEVTVLRAWNSADPGYFAGSNKVLIQHNKTRKRQFVDKTKVTDAAAPAYPQAPNLDDAGRRPAFLDRDK